MRSSARVDQRTSFVMIVMIALTLCGVLLSCSDPTRDEVAARQDVEIAALQKRIAAAEKHNAELEATLVEIRATTKRANDAMTDFLEWAKQSSATGSVGREAAEHIIWSQLQAKLPAAKTSDEATSAEATRRGVSSTLVNENYYEAPAVIEAHCTKEWPDDFHMREVCQREQREGVETLKATRPNIPAADFSTVRNKCGHEWPDDYHMRTVCEREQLESYANLRH